MQLFERADFLISCYRLDQLPEDSGGELIFLGRSNVGKSSLINRLCRKKLLARTSKTPGRTQCLNVFSLMDGYRLIDAPGYGFAKVPLSVKQAWQRLIETYCGGRYCLRAIVLVMDCRHPLQPQDQVWLEALAPSGIPVVIVLNKMDCLGRMQQNKSRLQVDTFCRKRGIPAEIAMVSSRLGQGVDQLRLSLTCWLSGETPEGRLKEDL